MNLYLTIITTALVMTQIIRVTQNAMQLRHLHKVHKYDDYIKKVYEKIERAADKYYLHSTVVLLKRVHYKLLQLLGFSFQYCRLSKLYWEFSIKQ